MGGWMIKAKLVDGAQGEFIEIKILVYKRNPKNI
jgi:hypothetical protein